MPWIKIAYNFFYNLIPVFWRIPLFECEIKVDDDWAFKTGADVSDWLDTAYSLNRFNTDSRCAFVCDVFVKWSASCSYKNSMDSSSWIIITLIMVWTAVTYVHRCVRHAWVTIRTSSKHGGIKQTFEIPAVTTSGLKLILVNHCHTHRTGCTGLHEGREMKNCCLLRKVSFWIISKAGQIQYRLLKQPFHNYY